MVTKKYKIGNFIIKVLSPIDYEDEEVISLFHTDGEDSDFTVHVEIVDSLPQKIDNPIFDSPSKICTENGNETYCYFKNTDSFGKNDKLIYARKRMVYGTHECTISILSSMQHKLCSRLIMILMSMEELVTENNCFIFHSSYINWNGKAIIFTGPCGMGKSTQADLWKKYRQVPIINGDKTLFYIDNNTAMAGGLPFSGSSEYCENLSLPIGAIIKLDKGKENEVHILNGFDAFNAVVGSCYPVTYSPYLINKQIDLAEKISARVPVLSFSCLPDESAVDYLEEKLWQIIQNQ